MYNKTLCEGLADNGSTYADKRAYMRKYAAENAAILTAKTAEWRKKNGRNLQAEYEADRKRRQFVKHFLDALKLFVGCERCRYAECSRSLHFHHTDPENKDFTIARKRRNLGRIVEECLKCEVLCANCHGATHA